MLTVFLFACMGFSDRSQNIEPISPPPSSEDSAAENPEEISSLTTEQAQERIREISSNICLKLNSCCDDSSQETYFSAYLSNQNLEEYAVYLPPNDTLNQEECTDVLTNMLQDTWLGSWMSAVERGEATFNDTEYQECLNHLTESSCGEDLEEELFNETCFGFLPPEGGEAKRLIFSRLQQEGETCQSIADGFGGMYYGSCNSEQNFCCLPSEVGCSPYPVLETDGICKRAAQEGESCSVQTPIQLCRSGLECSYESQTCVAPNHDELNLGASCYESSTYSLLGDCVDSWCDLFGSALCEPLKMNGEGCMLSESCGSGYCDFESSTCAPNNFCTFE